MPLKPALLTTAGGEGQGRESITPVPIPLHSKGVVGPVLYQSRLWGWLPVPLLLGPALLCCLGEVWGPPFRVLYLTKYRASSSTLMTLWAALTTFSGGRRGEQHTPPRDRRTVSSAFPHFKPLGLLIPLPYPPPPSTLPLAIKASSTVLSG